MACTLAISPERAKVTSHRLGPAVLRDNICLPKSPFCPEKASLHCLRDTCHTAGLNLRSFHM